MPKNIEDIIPNKPERRSIRNIPLPEKRRKTDVIDDPRNFTVPRPIPNPPEHLTPGEIAYARRDENLLPRMEVPEHKNISSNPSLFSRERRHSRKAIWIGAGIAVVVLMFAGFSLFSGATVTYVPKTAPIVFNNDVYTAYKTDHPDELLFSVIKLSGDKGVEAPAGGEENVSLKSSGKIIVYNAASESSERLIKNTRFESTDGKIYRTPTDIVIPGKQGSTPGSLEITVYADEPGSAYNIGLTDFTVPGLKSDPRYTTIYARSKTPMSGGFVGVTKKVSNEDLLKAKTTLESSLRDQLVNEAKAEVPEDFVLYPNLIQITYTDLPNSSSTASGVMVNRHADFYGVMFKKSDLANYVAKKKLTSELPSPIELTDIGSLDISFAGAATADLLKADQINIEISGNTAAVSRIDEEGLKNSLVGTKKSSIDQVLQKYPGIESANAVIRPVWKTSFPTDPSKINVKSSALK
jgi:hypothetical protein